MQPKSINPYSFLGQKHKDALDFIIANLPADPTFDNLNEVLCTALFPDFSEYPKASELITPYVKSILPNVYNGYVNGCLSPAGGSVPQGGTRVDSGTASVTGEDSSALITAILSGITTTPPENIEDFLDGMDEKIAASALTYQQQAPLFTATALGKSGAAYWSSFMENPGVWAVYLSNNPAFNYMHLAGYVSATVQGALLGYGLIQPPQIQLIDIHTALIGATGLAGGKVVFGWNP